MNLNSVHTTEIVPVPMEVFMNKLFKDGQHAWFPSFLLCFVPLLIIPAFFLHPEGMIWVILNKSGKIAATIRDTTIKVILILTEGSFTSFLFSFWVIALVGGIVWAKTYTKQVRRECDRKLKVLNRRVEKKACKKANTYKKSEPARKKTTSFAPVKLALVPQCFTVHNIQEHSRQYKTSPPVSPSSYEGSDDDSWLDQAVENLNRIAIRKSSNNAKPSSRKVYATGNLKSKVRKPKRMEPVITKESTTELNPVKKTTHTITSKPSRAKPEQMEEPKPTKPTVPESIVPKSVCIETTVLHHGSTILTPKVVANQRNEDVVDVKPSTTNYKSKCYNNARQNRKHYVGYKNGQVKQQRASRFKSQSNTQTSQHRAIEGEYMNFNRFSQNRGKSSYMPRRTKNSKFHSQHKHAVETGLYVPTENNCHVLRKANDKNKYNIPTQSGYAFETKESGFGEFSMLHNYHRSRQSENQSQNQMSMFQHVNKSSSNPTTFQKLQKQGHNNIQTDTELEINMHSIATQMSSSVLDFE